MSKDKEVFIKIISCITFFFLLLLAAGNMLMYHASNLRRFWILMGMLIVGIVYFYVAIYCYVHVYLVSRKLGEVLRSVQDEENIHENDNLSSVKARSMLVRLYQSASRTKEQNLLRKQAELNALQNQIDPHFLYNTLECIRGKALMEGVEQIADMTEALSAFFRYSISIQGNLVTLREEIKNTENYFLIQQYRFGNRFQMKMIFDDCSEQVGECLLPKLTLQPLVENAIFHGLEKIISEGLITIRVIETEKRLILLVEDNGAGITPEELSAIQKSLDSGEVTHTKKNNHTGVALQNINERIRLHFGFKYGMQISSEEGGGTDITITLPKIVKTEQ